MGAEYIKREDAKEYLYNFASKEFHTRDMVFAGRLTAIQIKDILSADAAPVRHGHWIKISPAGIYECSECGKNVMTSDIEAYVWCHGCGARMDGEK